MDFFNSMDHEILVRLLEKKIDDRRFVKLIKSMLNAGYLEQRRFHKTYSGCPQGGVISPILSGIYLHELDQFMDELAKQFNKGEGRPINPQYSRVTQAKYQLRKIIDKQGKKPELVDKFLELEKLTKGCQYNNQ